MKNEKHVTLLHVHRSHSGIPAFRHSSIPGIRRPSIFLMILMIEADKIS